MDKKYLVLESLENDPVNKRVIVCNNVGEAFKLWLEKPTVREIVKRIEVEVKERGH